MRRPGKGRLSFCAAGAVAGTVNGLFGGGGGMPLVPLLRRRGALREKEAFATSLAIVLPFCVVSALFYLASGELSFETALPYLAGGTLGGWAGGKLFRRVPARALRICFTVFVFYGAWRYLH